MMVYMTWQIDFDHLIAEQFFNFPRDFWILVMEAVRTGVEAELTVLDGDRISTGPRLRLVNRKRNPHLAGKIPSCQASGSASEDGDMI